MVKKIEQVLLVRKNNFLSAAHDGKPQASCSPYKKRLAEHRPCERLTGQTSAIRRNIWPGKLNKENYWPGICTVGKDR